MHIKEQDDSRIVPDKIRFDETSQSAEGFANVSVIRFAEHDENSEVF